MPDIKDAFLQGFYNLWYLPLILLALGLFKIFIYRFKKRLKKKKHPSQQKTKSYSIVDKKEYAQRIRENRQKGREYEEFVGGYFKLDGYEVDLNGIKKGVKDKGIDIVCKKDNELILIQCKNWSANTKYKINHEKLKAFVGACTEYVNEHKLFDRNIKLKFITSNYILDESAKKYLEESRTLKYQVLQF